MSSSISKKKHNISKENVYLYFVREKTCRYNHEQERKQRYFVVSLLLSALCYSFTGNTLSSVVWVSCGLGVVCACYGWHLRVHIREPPRMSHCAKIMDTQAIYGWPHQCHATILRAHLKFWSSFSYLQLRTPKDKSSCLYFTVEVQIFLRHNFKEQGITLKPVKLLRRKAEKWWSNGIWFFMTLEKPILACSFP